MREKGARTVSVCVLFPTRVPAVLLKKNKRGGESNKKRRGKKPLAVSLEQNKRDYAKVN